MEWTIKGQSGREHFKMVVEDEDSYDIIHTLNEFMCDKGENVQGWSWKVFDADGREWVSVGWMGDDCVYRTNTNMHGLHIDEFETMAEEADDLSFEWTKEAHQGFPYF